MRGLIRRVIGALTVAVVAAVGLWTPGLAAPVPEVNNLGLRTIPFQVTNLTERPGNLYVYVQGQVPSQGNQWYYLSNANGDVTIVPQAAPPGVALALNLGTAQKRTIQLPQLAAARIYFSIGQPLLVYANAQGAAPSSPSGWSTGDPNYNTDFDWAEFTWLNDPAGTGFVSTLGINVTQVDMFGMAMLLALKGMNDARTVVVKKSGFNADGARKRIFAQLKGAGAPWNALVLGPANTPIRAIAPYHGIEMGVFPATFLDAYIKQVWAKYAGDTMQGGNANHTYGGRVVGGDLVFNDTTGSDPQFKFVKPTTKAAFENALPPIPCAPNTDPCGRAGAIGALLGAAFMRTTLLQEPNLNACRVTTFYTNEPVNVFAKTFHENALRHLAYSFGFDDTCNQSSFIQIHNPQSLNITLQK